MGLIAVVGAAVMDNCSKYMFIQALACCVYTSLNLIILLSIKDEIEGDKQLFISSLQQPVEIAVKFVTEYYRGEFIDDGNTQG